MIGLDAFLAVGLAVVAAPPTALGLMSLLGIKLREGVEARVAAAHSVAVLVATAVVVVAWLAHPTKAYELELPDVLQIDGYRWHAALLVDPLGATYAALVALVYPVVVRFSMPSFFREAGSSRYWFLVTLLAAALWALCFAGNLDALFVAWELVGITSVMLIGFFRRQVRAAQNSLRALVYYRLGDFFLLLAAVLIHHSFPDQHFVRFDADARAPHALLVGFALLFGSLAKSAQLPMSPWLHRAMEGPAASSAIFYGALSVHLGPFLLLRTSKLWFDEPVVLWSMGAIGALTAMWASAVGRTRPDAKTALAYSTMTQIGVMYVELALGMHKLVAFHMFAHAGLRTWQFLRSSSLIQDFQDNPVFAASIGLRRRLFVERILPLRLQRWLYVAAVRLFWIDSIQWHFVARPFLALFTGLVALEDWALGRKGREEASR